jgi:predicted phage terminase large subunit-like protein
MSYIPQALINEGEAILCRRHLRRFVRTFWPVIISEEIVWEEHMGALCDEIQAVYERVFLRPDPDDPEHKIRLPKENDLIINIPPGTSKSTIATIMAPAWAWVNDPSLRIITGSYSDALATEHSQKSRDIITSDPYKILFPHVKIKDDKGLKTNYETTANGQRFATSVRGTVTGVHAHVITIDDPLNPQQAASQVELKTANSWMDKTLSTRKVDKKVTVRILIMQRLAVNDPTGAALAKKKEKVRHINLPGEYSKNTSPDYKWIYDKNGGLLSPKRLGWPELKELREDLGSSGYAGQIGQEPTPEGGLTWKESWFIKVPDHLFPSIEQAHEVANDWDLAYTKEDKNAASAFITSGVLAGKIYIFDFGWAWKEFPEMIKWMRSIPYPHFIEAKASGKSAKQTLKGRGIVAVEVKVNKDKIARAKDAAPAVEAGMVYIRESMADRFFNDPKQGILYFPSGEYADLADTLSQMVVRRTKKGSITSSAGTRQRGPTSPGDPGPELNPLDWIK